MKKAIRVGTTYYLVVVDESLFGKKFYLKNRKGNVHDPVYGRNNITSSISNAKVYLKQGNAENMASKIAEEIGQATKVYSWEPKNFDLTKFVKMVK